MQSVIEQRFKCRIHLLFLLFQTREKTEKIVIGKTDHENLSHSEQVDAKFKDILHKKHL